MAIRAVSNIEAIDLGSQTDTFNVLAKYVTDDNIINDTVTLADVPMNILQSTLNTAIKTAVKDKMVNQQGYTFGLFDVVIVIGAVII